MGGQDRSSEGVRSPGSNRAIRLVGLSRCRFVRSGAAAGEDAQCHGFWDVSGVQRNLDRLIVLDHPVELDFGTVQCMSPSSASRGVSL